MWPLKSTEIRAALCLCNVMIYLQREFLVVSGFCKEKYMIFHQITWGMSFQIFGLPGFPLEIPCRHKWRLEGKLDESLVGWKGHLKKAKRSLMKLLFFKNLYRALFPWKVMNIQLINSWNFQTPNRTRLNFFWLRIMTSKMAHGQWFWMSSLKLDTITNRWAESQAGFIGWIFGPCNLAAVSCQNLHRDWEIRIQQTC